MNGKMKIELCQNQLQSENSQAEENHETEAKVEEVFKSVTHLHEVNEEDDSSCSNSLLRREMTIFHSLPEVTEGNQNIQSAFKEPDICTIPIPDKKDSKKEPPDVVEGQPVTLTPSAAVINLVDERNQCTKDDKAAHIVPNVGEYKTVIENEENALKAAKEEHKLPNGSILVKDQLLEETTNRPKLDDIFSNSIGGSLSDSRELPSASPANQQVLVVEEKKIKPASLFPDMKVKTPEETINRPKLDEIFSNPIEGSLNRSSELPSACPPAEQVVAAEKRKPASPVPPKKAKVPSSDSEMKKSSIPIPPPLPSSTENLTDKPLSLQTCETKVDKIENNLPNSCIAKKEENVSSVVGGANLKHSAPSCSTNQDGTPVHEKKVNKQRPSTTPKSPPSMCQKIPPKESMMAGGECFASADGIEQETSGVTATQRRNSNTTQQRTRETGQSRTAISRNLSKIRNEKAWRRRHLMIAGGVGIAIVCFYAFYKCKT